MTKVKRRWDILTDEKRKIMIEEIMTYFKNEMDETIGMIAAEKILDFFLENLGLDIYNSAISESKRWLKTRHDDMEIDFDVMLK
ncbi:hypothetical protein COV93_08810 [Candidatus Woesearchaeota archaeon CG11_big_fil_rev_8_21_14_0_20_43_8]|nr:MAG: hypothetical protein COV93_08810 [Candidatus Woesearchaeota archaeon CG11_big_fil_rev_8_21_14_0_20_43_8]PIO05599.1 MAG: DUF2164 domain-containing protein [Candidatus Woesearchaeota archaeon CG08_land_8_20_14_0_20_43_7]